MLIQLRGMVNVRLLYFPLYAKHLSICLKIINISRNCGIYFQNKKLYTKYAIHTENHIIFE